MAEYTSIRVTVDAKDAAEQSKRDGETWGEYIRRCTDNPPEIREFVDGNVELNTDDVVERLKNELSMADDPTVEVDVDRIIGRVDDLEAQLPRKVAEELR